MRRRWHLFRLPSGRLGSSRILDGVGKWRTGECHLRARELTEPSVQFFLSAQASVLRCGRTVGIYSASGSEDATVNIYGAHTTVFAKATLFRLHEHRGAVSSTLAFSPDSRRSPSALLEDAQDIDEGKAARKHRSIAGSRHCSPVAV